LDRSWTGVGQELDREMDGRGTGKGWKRGGRWMERNGRVTSEGRERTKESVESESGEDHNLMTLSI
jgi:hypothetical protein